MATQIKETPVLTGRDAVNFYRKIKEVKKVPIYELDRIKASAERINIALLNADISPICRG